MLQAGPCLTGQPQGLGEVVAGDHALVRTTRVRTELPRQSFERYEVWCAAHDELSRGISAGRIGWGFVWRLGCWQHLRELPLHLLALSSYSRLAKGPGAAHARRGGRFGARTWRAAHRGTPAGSLSARSSTGACASSPASIGPRWSCSCRRRGVRLVIQLNDVFVDNPRSCTPSIGIRVAYSCWRCGSDRSACGLVAASAQRSGTDATARRAGIALTWGLDLG
jgi:hypothetical protein